MASVGLQCLHDVHACFGMLPWLQTRPPRAFEPADPWRSFVRPLNLRLLGAASIQVNTFPSGHAAEAFAAALLVTGAPVSAVVVMWLAALAVTAGAVLGRYRDTPCVGLCARRPAGS